MPYVPPRRLRVCSLLAAVALAAAVRADPAPAVQTRPDPFATLDALNAGRIASTWSSLPAGAGCADGRTSLSGHASLLLEPSSERQDLRPGLFSLVDRRHRLQGDASGRWGCVFAQVALQRQIGEHGDYWSWDGSALSWRIDEHWRVGAGRIARHWGPGWDGSLILGSAARPFPSVAVDAATGVLSRDGFWGWLREVEFSAFFAELDDDRRDYARPYLMGARLVVRPWASLELAASRTAMWGGEGRDNSLGMFLRSLAGRDNQDGDPRWQPGNGLGGFDARWDVSQWLPGIALYGQMIGEDEAANLPSKYMFLAGADWRRRDALAFVEWTDSTAKLAGVAYNHHIFTDGYRYRGQPLGHWADGDSNLWTAGGLLRDVLGGEALVVLRYGELNRAGRNPCWPDARLGSASLQWRTVLDGVFGLTLALDHLSISPRGAGVGDATRDTQLRLQFDAWLD